MNLFPLPLEIFERIACSLDGQTLLSFGEVCEDFYQIVNNPNKDLIKVWRNNCINEIPEDDRIDILHKLYPKYWLDESNVRWHIVYKCWARRHNFEKWKLSCKAIDTEQYEISCMLISGDWILIGTINRGSLIAFNSVTNKKTVLYKGANVIDIQLRCTTEKFLIDEQSDLLSGISHDEIILHLETKSDAVMDLHSGFTKLFARSNILCQLKFFENWKVRVTIENQITYMNVINTESPDEKYYMTLGRNTLKVLQIWNGKIATLAHDPNLLRIMMFSYKLNSCRFTHVFNNKGKFFSWHANVFAQTSGTMNNHELRMSVGERCVSYYPFQKLSIHVESATYYCCVLFLGTDIGTVYAFRLSNDDELLHLDLSKYSWCYEVCNEPIISLVIKETEEKPILFVSTSCTVFELCFN